jgi:hypothetical protein
VRIFKKIRTEFLKKAIKRTAVRLIAFLLFDFLSAGFGYQRTNEPTNQSN